MSKALPVYELGQWLKNKGAIGRIVARSVGEGFGILPEFDGNVQVHGMSDRGLGYCVEWVMLEFPSMVDPRDPLAEPPYVYEAPIGFRPLRIRWIGSKTMADPRYHPCENPVKVPVVQSDSAAQIELEKAICAEESQPALPLDIEARWCGGAEQVVEAMATVENASVDIMRAVVTAGKKAEDWLIAKGLTP